MLVILAGLPGTGKSTLARAVAARSGAFVLDKDAVRAALFPPALIEYSREQDDFVLRVMLKVAGWMVRRDPRAIVVIDGRPFSQKYQLDQVIHFAEWVKTPWRIVECTCPEAIVRERIASDAHPAADRNFELYERVRSEWQPIEREKLVLRCELAAAGNAARVMEYLTHAGS